MNFCGNDPAMQYYRGKAIRHDRQEEEITIPSKQQPIKRIGRILFYPLMLFFWILQVLIHKSVEEDIYV